MAKTVPFPLEIITERLAIRSPSANDAEGLREAVAESLNELRPWLPWATHVPTPEEAVQNCARAAREFEEGRDFRLHLFHRDSGAFVGGSGLHRVDWSVPKFEIGYWIRTSYAGQGLITEAVEALTAFAMKRLGALRVEIRASSKNVRSWRVAERLGFSLDGVLCNDGRHLDGSLRDTVIYSKTSGEAPVA